MTSHQWNPQAHVSKILMYAERILVIECHWKSYFRMKNFSLGLAASMSSDSLSKYVFTQSGVYFLIFHAAAKCILSSFRMMLWHGTAICITGHLWGESACHRWIPLAKGQQCGALFYLKKAWTSCWTNCQVANDLSCHGTHIASLLCELMSCLMIPWLLVFPCCNHTILHRISMIGGHHWWNWYIQ